MRIGYHNHAQEMAGTVGGTPWDVIAQETPQAKLLQQGVGWTVFAGKDPAAYVRRYPGRSITVHSKGKLTEWPTGNPIIDQDGTEWEGLIRVVREVGKTEWIIVEKEEYPSSMRQLESVAGSLAGLKRLMAHEAE